ncbi:MAG: hypothetical protein U5J83_00835 [Bryobacterales bacterium]|nr:hypothetical protein [Bryobacterales bacterium]
MRFILTGDGITAFWQAGLARGEASLCGHEPSGEIRWSKPIMDRFVDLIPFATGDFCAVVYRLATRAMRFSWYTPTGHLRAETEIEFTGALLGTAANDDLVSVIGSDSTFFQRRWGGGQQKAVMGSGPLDAPKVGGSQARFAKLLAFSYGAGWILLDQIRGQYSELNSNLAESRSGVLKHPLIQKSVSQQDSAVESRSDELARLGRSGSVSMPLSIFAAALDFVGGLWVVPSPLNPSNISVFRVELNRLEAGETRRIPLPAKQVVGNLPPLLFSSFKTTCAFAYRTGFAVQFDT